MYFTTDLFKNKSDSESSSTTTGTMENSKVLDYIDTSFDPCEDFYNYSCGRWNSTRPYAAEWGTFEELALDNYNKLAGYLSQDVNSSDPDAIKKAKYIYSACTDTDYIKDNLDDQLDSFMNKAGGWKNGDFTPYDYSWSINNNLYQDHYLGSSAFFSFGISPDDLDSSKQVIRVTCMCTTNYRCDLHNIILFQIYQDGLTLGEPEEYFTDVRYCQLVHTFHNAAIFPYVYVYVCRIMIQIL